MEVVIPFDDRRPKTRLAPVLDEPERRTFARTMLRDVVDTLRHIDREPTILANDNVDVDAAVVIDERPLTDAVNGVLDDGGEVAIIMADLALATPASLQRLFQASADVVLAPGLGGGTNAVVVSHPTFRVDYHGASIRDHRRIAREVDASRATIDSFRLALDIDEPSDLAELLLHGRGASVDWLRDRGFTVTTTDGRVGVER